MNDFIGYKLDVDYSSESLFLAHQTGLAIEFGRDKRDFWSHTRKVNPRVTVEQFRSAVHEAAAEVWADYLGADTKQIVLSAPRPTFEMLRLTDVEEKDHGFEFSGDIARVVINYTETRRGSVHVESYEEIDGAGEEEAKDSFIYEAHVTTYGERALAEPIIALISKKIKALRNTAKSSVIKWLFTDGSDMSYKIFEIRKTWEIKPSFYPWLGMTPLDYYKAFVESNAQTLVLYGPPGTGKTSFIRDFLVETGSNAVVSYDVKILESDSTFVHYLCDEQVDVIIIEDADELLTSNRGEHGKILAKLLNVSDGLIKLPKKKIIFTTNLPSVKDIDKAIIRPGRCFDAVEFRAMTQPEACNAAADLSLETLSIDKSAYTLAELFAMGKANKDPLLTRGAIGKRIGF